MKESIENGNERYRQMMKGTGIKNGEKRYLHTDDGDNEEERYR